MKMCAKFKKYLCNLGIHPSANFTVRCNMNSNLITFRIFYLSTRKEGEVLVSERHVFAVHFPSVMRTAVSTFLSTSGVFACY
jgi:hypothetical protein